MKKAIYTVITNDYDTLKTPAIRQPDYDYICFTDNKDLNSDFWDIKVVRKKSRHLQREIKLLPHKYLPDYDLTIYVDANMQINRSFSNIERNVSKSGIVLIRHNNRNCVYQEAVAVINLKKDTKESVDKQMTAYAAERMPQRFGMYSSGLMIRLNRPDVNDFCSFWWKEVQKFSHRDQLSITYALWKTKLKPSVVPFATMLAHISINKHKSQQQLKVFYSTPARSDKNIGLAYNEFMQTVPDDAWVCLRDGDTMFTTPDWPQHIEEIIKANEGKFDLISCMTNRLRGEHQLIPGMFDCDSISEHLKTSQSIKSTEVVPAKAVAGLCLIFKKSLWNKVKFVENSIVFDTLFSNQVKRYGFKIGVAKGLYLLHLYRYGQDNPKEYIKHLLK